MIHQFCSGYGQHDTHIHNGKPYETIDATAIHAMVLDPPSVPKEQGQWFIPSTYHEHDARSHAVQRTQGRFHWLAADIDKGSPPLEAVAAAVRETLPGIAFLIYSSRSAKSDDLRWRVLVPVETPLKGVGYAASQKEWFDQLEAKGLMLDRSLERTGQLIYLPNRGEYYASHIEPGVMLQPDAPLFAAAVSRAQEIANEVAERKNKSAFGPIAAFNEKHSIEELLVAYGYERKGSSDDWRSPHQQSGSYATHDYGDFWISLSHSDAAAGLGRASGPGHRYGDAFDLYKHHGCAGDEAEALKYARRLIDGDATAEHGRQIWEGLTHIHGQRILFRNEQTIVLEERAEAIKLPGLAGAIAEVVYRAEKRDTRVYANAAGLLAMSALAAPFYALQTHPDEGLVSLHIYALVIGPTASGKEGIRTAIRLALEAAGRGDEFLDGIPSLPALQDHLAHPTDAQAPGAVTLAMDEAGLNLKTINSTANGHQQILLKGLMSLFGQAFSKLTPHKTRDRDMRIDAVDKPRTTLLWTSTPGAFIDAINAKDSESGQLNRFGSWWVADMPPLRKERAERALLQGQLPPNIQHQCAKFQYEAKEEYHGQRQPDKIIPTTPEALVLMDAFEQEVEHQHIQGKPPRHRESWGRAVEYLKKYAGLVALADNLNAPECRPEHVELAREIVMATVGATAEVADRSAAKNVKPDSWEKVLAYIAEHKNAEGWASLRDVKRNALRGHDNREQILEEMKTAGFIEMDQVPSGGRPAAQVRILVA